MSNTQQLQAEFADDAEKPAAEATLDEGGHQAEPGVEHEAGAADPDRTTDGEVDPPLTSEPVVGAPALFAVEEPGPGALEEPPPPRPRAGTSEVRQFIAMLRRERKLRARVRRLKRLGWAVAAAAAAGYLAARSSAPDAAGVSAGPPVALAAAESLPAEAPPFAVAPAEPEVERDPGPAAGQPPEAALCEASFAQQRWRSAVESCTRVFEQEPGAALALRIAHAHYARGQSSPAGFWARTALGLGTRDADAYVLIGHSERQAGHTKNAVDAYRRYLESSPRGWHAKRLRAALRELSSKRAYHEPSARRDAERTL